MSYVWTFEPETTPDRPAYRTMPEGYEPRPKRYKDVWTAPEHRRLSQDMKKDYPRNDKGERVEGKKKELVIDPRPTILVPPRPTRIGWL